MGDPKGAHVEDLARRSFLKRGLVPPKFILRMKLSDWEKAASAYITGRSIQEGWDGKSDIVIEVEQTKMSWKRKNGGPDILVVPEHTIWCLMQDVVSLTKRGINVTFEEVLVDSPGE